MLPVSFDRSMRANKIPAADVIQGTLDLLVLKALVRAPIHGWGIAARIKELSDDAFQLGQGSLYPALHRLEKRGWITSIWRQTEKNRIARFYELTAKGRQALEDRIKRWRAYASAIDLVIDAD
jgi:transcriptional regulator